MAAAAAVYKMSGGTPSQSSAKCRRCRKKGHGPQKCKFRESKCHKCGKLGHIAPVCRSARRNDNQPSGITKSSNGTKWVAVDPSSPFQEADDLGVFTLGGRTSAPIRVEFQVNGKPLLMEVDTGAAVFVIPEQQLTSHYPEAQICPCKVILRTYTGEPIEVLGKLKVSAQYQHQPSRSCHLW